MDKMVKLQVRVYKMEVNNKVLIITDMNQGSVAKLNL